MLLPDTPKQFTEKLFIMDYTFQLNFNQKT